MEESLLENKGLITLFFARMVSIVFVIFVSYIIFIAISVTLSTLIPSVDIDASTFKIPLVIMLPFLLVLMQNFFNQKYNFSKNILKVFIIYSDSFPKIDSFKFLVEFFFFLLYISFASAITAEAIANIIWQAEFTKYAINYITIAAVFHSAIYLFIRVYLIPENTDQQKLIKAKRKLGLWTSYSLIALVHIIITMIQSIPWSGSLYYIFLFFSFLKGL
ncbi:hypothetical protein NC661_06515 [Aquibacillus koreensis]|uniref:Uncharacterized protein n=1 Tax=Aquibacillus koreensis TaxID=279446 RepID=A0A9X3WMK8_9BACI|nr:hypothetical protein [Aquibacillus koreensis]MCT2535696.1 hypothetical protein [Aquibacillus koreensis]MDC3420019.1 hypothetical protein [Aquibacillus koreensis]